MELVNIKSTLLNLLKVSLLLISCICLIVLSSKVQANTPIEPCMEERCIVYFNKWKTMANSKRVLAMSAVAELYYNGYGTKKNLTQSIRYFRKASRYHFPYAQFRVGVFYLMEEAFLDYEMGVKYLKKAARNGHTESAFLLGVIYGTGDLGIQSLDESDKWLEKALKANHPIAQQYAGYLYNSGQVGEEEYVKVNKLVAKLDILITDTKDIESKSSNVRSEIQWPEDPDREVITVSAPR
jgi:tetratricopeptide (TPR) repeat protein